VIIRAKGGIYGNPVSGHYPGHCGTDTIREILSNSMLTGIGGCGRKKLSM